MLKFIKDIKAFLADFYSFEDYVMRQIMKEPDMTSAALLRHKLGSIDITDVPQPPKDGPEREIYVADASVAYYELVKPICERFIRAQEEWMARQSNGPDQFEIGRGTINGIFLILDEFEKLNAEHQENTTPPAPFDAHDPIGNLTPN